MASKAPKKSAKATTKVEVLGPTYEKGKPEGEEAGRWRKKLETRADKLHYLETGERYWYSDDWFGSEKRKTRA